MQTHFSRDEVEAFWCGICDQALGKSMTSSLFDSLIRGEHCRHSIVGLCWYILHQRDFEINPSNLPEHSIGCRDTATTYCLTVQSDQSWNRTEIWEWANTLCRWVVAAAKWDQEGAPLFCLPPNTRRQLISWARETVSGTLSACCKVFWGSLKTCISEWNMICKVWGGRQGALWQE